MPRARKSKEGVQNPPKHCLHKNGTWKKHYKEYRLRCRWCGKEAIFEPLQDFAFNPKQKTVELDPLEVPQL